MKSIDELIEASSLGTPHARAMRASVSDDDAQRVVRMSAIYGAFLTFGFTDEQAWALAKSGPDTVFIVPLSVVGL